MFRKIKEDISIVFERDPAARSKLEVFLCYPGIHAIVLHRVNHQLWESGFTTLARLSAHFARWVTGIEIHPAAKIGRGFFIDHGMGVVIGETAEVGDNVTLYHQVTLGGTSTKKVKRHPTLGNNIVVGAGAKILGNITIGDDSRVGAGSVVVNDVPAHSTVVGVPGRVVRNRVGEQNENAMDIDWQKLPDPMVKALQCLLERVTLTEANLKEQLNEVEEDFKALKCMAIDESKLADFNEHKEKRKKQSKKSEKNCS